jgi:uncharacterized protein (TIGR03663 family)
MNEIANTSSANRLDQATFSNALQQRLAQWLRLDTEKVLWLLLVVLAVVTRFYLLDARVISHDESLHTYYSWELFKGKGYQHNPMMHGPFQFHALALSYLLFGDSDFSARIPAALSGVAAVLLCWFFRPWFGKIGAYLAGLFVLISPYLLYYTRYVRNEPFVIVWALLMVLTMLYYYRDRKPIYLYSLAGAVALQYATKETSYIYLAIWLLFLGLVWLRDVLVISWGDKAGHKALFFGLVLLGFLVAGLGYWAGVRGIGAGLDAGTGTTTPVTPGSIDTGGHFELPLITVIALLLGAISLIAALVLVILDLGNKLRQLPSLDLMVICGTFTLPMGVAFVIDVIIKRWNSLDYNSPSIFYTGVVIAIFIAVSAGLGVLWDMRRWLVAAAVFYSIFIVLYTTIFTNGVGFFSGVVGSLGYWIDQQAVQRGGQPDYYYFLQLPIYEYMPTLGWLLATIPGVTWVIRFFFKQDGVSKISQWLSKSATPSKKGDPQPEITHTVNTFPTAFFLWYWGLASLAAFSKAGEKMPWLTVHITLPMVLLTAWWLGRLLENIEWGKLRSQAGLVLSVCIPLFFIAFGTVLAAFLLPEKRPFTGSELTQQNATLNFVFALLFLVLTTYGVFHFIRLWGTKLVLRYALAMLFALLAVLTLRTAVYANYINYDNQTELINYASGGPGNRIILEQLQKISLRTTGSYEIKVGSDNLSSWPMTWYMRNYPKHVYYGTVLGRDQVPDMKVVMAGSGNWAGVESVLGDDYYKFTYIRMWWPMEEYKNLTLDRVSNALFVDGQYRQALWNIWFQRDYKLYGTLSHQNADYFNLANWPVSDQIALYIHRDLAAQLWDLGVGPQAVVEPLKPDPFKAVEQNLNAQSTLLDGGSQSLLKPRDVAVSPDGNSIYILDTFNNRVVQQDSKGTFIRSFGSFGKVEEGAGLGALNEPWGIATDNKGFVYVADTWNHRVQKFSADGKPLQVFGTFGNDIANLNGMWGPRDVAVDTEGRIYVTDTGNKRILVFAADGTPLRQIGSGGATAGLLDEPVGIAVNDKDEIIVADTWNRRVQVFGNDGTFLREWSIEPAWKGTSLANKPYVAVAPNGNVYITDPEGYRILATDSSGTPLFMSGQFGTDMSSFNIPSGLTVSADGKTLYVVDGDNNRVQLFSLP